MNSQNLRTAFALTALITFPLAVNAAPTISSVSGTAGTGQTLRIAGAGFGTKSPAAPQLWAPFDNSVQPSSLGVIKTWAQAQNIAWTASGYSGGGVGGSNDTGVWILGLDYPAGLNTYNKKSYWFRRQKMNFVVTSYTTHNWKDWRLWKAGGSGYPNIYTAYNNGLHNVEGIESAGGYDAINPKTTSWIAEENFFKANTGSNRKDGYVRRYQNNVQVSNVAVNSRNEASSTGSSLMVRNYVVHGVLANKSRWDPAWSSSNRAWWDDVYFDDTFQRVMIGNASTWGACSKFGFVIPTAWTTSSVTGQVHVASGDFPRGSRAYVYVFDTDNNPNASGYAVTIGEGQEQQPVNQAPTANAGSDKTLAFGQTGNLDGRATDDGLPNPPAAVTHSWTQILGPAAAAIVNAAALATPVNFPAVGQYVLRLTVSDGALSSIDDVIFTIQAVNQPPSVSAGADRAATAGLPVALSGTLSDDGLPNPPAAATVAWTSVAGPAAPIIAVPTGLSTDVTFPVEGQYVLELTATDGVLSAVDSITVTVAPSEGNRAPVVQAGDDLVTVLPAAASLTGSATDDGLPAGSQLSYVWTKLAGPGTVGFGDINRPDTTATFSAEGIYTLQLTASDGVLSAVDTLSIDVKSAVVAGGAPVISGASGRLQPGGVLNIVGGNFGDKVPAAPYLWADFEQSLEPTSAGVQKNWNEVHSMMWTTEGYGGSRGAKASDSNGHWTLRTDFNSWTADGQKTYMYKKQRLNFLLSSDTQNWQIWRMWPASVTYPNLYATANLGRVFVENIGQESGFWASFKPGTTNWVTEEKILQASSTMGKKDGSLVIRYDGIDKARGSLMTRSSVSPTLMTRNFVVHGVTANRSSWSPAWNTANRLWVDDVYVDTTWARVMIGEANTYAACRMLEIQIPTAWANGSVTVAARPGRFAVGTRVYLYVFDKNGQVNTEGFPITVETSPIGALVDGGGEFHDGIDAPARNVFNPLRGEKASLSYVLKQPGWVAVDIFDRGGRRVKELLGDQRLEGEHSIPWDGRNEDGSVVASGIYLAVAKGSEGSRARHKIAVVK